VTKVFIGGSRRITRLEAEVRRRLDRIVEKGLPVVIGDANGADRAVQRYLNDRRFEQRRCVWRYGPPDSRQRSDPGRCTVAGRQGGREFGPPVALFRLHTSNPSLSFSQASGLAEKQPPPA
jgi:hypothetical protein